MASRHDNEAETDDSQTDQTAAVQLCVRKSVMKMTKSSDDSGTTGWPEKKSSAGTVQTIRRTHNICQNSN